MIKRYNTRGNVTYHGTTVREQQNRQFSDPRLVSDGFGGAYDFIREMQIQDAAAIRAAERGKANEC